MRRDRRSVASHFHSSVGLILLLHSCLQNKQDKPEKHYPNAGTTVPKHACTKRGSGSKTICHPACTSRLTRTDGRFVPLVVYENAHDRTTAKFNHFDGHAFCWNKT